MGIEPIPRPIYSGKVLLLVSLNVHSVGFEPTTPKRLVLKTSALDRSAKNAFNKIPFLGLSGLESNAF